MRYTHASFLFPLFFFCFFFKFHGAQVVKRTLLSVVEVVSTSPPPPFHTLSNPSRGHPLLLRVFFGKCIYSSILILPVCTTVRGKNDPFCTPCETSVSSDVFVLVKGKKKHCEKCKCRCVRVATHFCTEERAFYRHRKQLA